MTGGDGPTDRRRAHYFDTFVEKFMPEPPGDKVDTAVAKVLESLVGGVKGRTTDGGGDGL